MKRASERRGTRQVPDTGARTRRTDHLHTPHSLQEWITTFNLRWVDHLHRNPNGGRPHTA